VLEQSLRSGCGQSGGHSAYARPTTVPRGPARRTVLLVTRDLGCARCDRDVDIFRTHWQAEYDDHRRTFYFCSEVCGKEHARITGTRWAWLRRDGRAEH
jgi:hypothetical protein